MTSLGLFCSACLLYAHAFLGTATFGSDIEELCQAGRGETYVEAEAAQSWVPLSRTCGAEYDLIPGYVNPALVVLAVAAALLYAAALVVRPPGDLGHDHA